MGRQGEHARTHRRDSASVARSLPAHAVERSRYPGCAHLGTMQASFDSKGIYRIVTSRQKTGTDVSVPIPPDVAEELLALANTNKKYVFWTGGSLGETIAKTWANRYIRPIFEAAKIPCEGHMLSHRLRDTFAVDLLEKGVPLEEVSKALGHESIKTTERHYAKWVKRRQDRLDSFITGTWSAN